jgi:hypothetical protein
MLDMSLRVVLRYRLGQCLVGLKREQQIRRSFVRARFALRRPSQMNGSQRFGLKTAQAGVEFRGPGLRCVLR